MAVVFRFLVHALFLPAFEGPDEPQHLARASAFADVSWSAAFRGVDMDPAVIAATASRPCGPDLRRAYGCPPFGNDPASFNLLSDAPPPSPRPPQPNHENHQPPLYYLLCGILLRVLRGVGFSVVTPEDRLLALRLFSVALVAMTLFWPLRVLARGRSAAAVTGALLILTVPGGSEALARCSNDAMLFFWAAGALAIVGRGTPAVWPILWVAIGPLIKLTAIPVVVVVLVVLWMRGQRVPAIIGAAGALLVVPIQWLRGWRWGGTYELNRPPKELDESLFELLVGLLRSVYTFLKTTIWLGNWSFFRPPAVILIIAAALALLWLALAKRRDAPRWAPAHLAGALVAAAAVLLFSVANRRLFGDWGGLGGWYAWSWFPWLALAANDLATVERRWCLPLLLSTAIVSAFINTIYYSFAILLYG